MSIQNQTQQHKPRYNWKNISSQVNTRLRAYSTIEYGTLTKIISDAMSTNCSHKTTNGRLVPPWWSARCQALLCQRKFLFKRATRLCSEEWWMKYKRAAAKLRQVIKERKKMFWDSICKDAGDPGILYKVFRKFHKPQEPTYSSNNVLRHEGRFIYDPEEQANIFAAQFASDAPSVPLPVAYGDDYTCSPLNRPFELAELMAAIRVAKVSTPGADGISMALFKGLNRHSLSLLLQVYNGVWQSGSFPPSWKEALIIPILKPGKPRLQASSYRPISLTSVAVKICEKMIAKRLTIHLLQNDSVHARHFGFLPMKDSVTALTLLHEDWDRAKKEKQHMVGVSLDIQAAYDSVYIDGLILKCAQLGITGIVLRWIHNFLTDRKIKVRWRDSTSASYGSDRGVPQGAVLSPLLFMIFMSDFYDTLGPWIKSIIYADDIFIYCIDRVLESCIERLQLALREISQWCSYWMLTICPNKSQAIILSRRRGDSDIQLCIGNGLIEWSDEIKFLGFFLTRRGGLRAQVEHLRSKAFRKINLLKILANKKYGARSRHLVTLATATIRNLVDYGAPILEKVCSTLTKRLEVLQNCAMRVALGLPQWVPIIILRKHGHTPSIEGRIKLLAQRFWIKHISRYQNSPFWQAGYLDSPENLETFLNAHQSVREALEMGQCRAEHFLPFELPIQEMANNVTFSLGGLPFQNKNLPEPQIIPLFQSFLEDLKETHEIVATDASKTAGITSIAGVSSRGVFGYRVPSTNSVFTAEALALGMAMDEIISRVGPNLCLSDSLSVLQALQEVTLKSDRVVIWLHNKIHRAARLTPSLHFCWVPGHRGIDVNEKADKIARTVSERDILVEWVNPRDLTATCHKHANKLFEDNYTNSKYSQSHGDIPTIQESSYWASNRQEDVIISRLVCKMTVTPAILYRFGLAESNRCESCREVNDIDHILWHCTKYHSSRTECWQRVGLSVPSAQSHAELIKLLHNCPKSRSAVTRFVGQIG